MYISILPKLGLSSPGSIEAFSGLFYCLVDVFLSGFKRLSCKFPSQAMDEDALCISASAKVA